MIKVDVYILVKDDLFFKKLIYIDVDGKNVICEEIRRKLYEEEKVFKCEGEICIFIN